jgi:hypothetical protein
MPPAKDKAAATKRKQVIQKDQFKDFDEPEYWNSTSNKRSKFRTVFTVIGLEKSDEQCKAYWDHLRTQNFKTAGNWYTEQVYSDDTPVMTGRGTLSAAKIQEEIKQNQSYLIKQLSECTTLSPLQAAARYVTFIVEQEGKDCHSFIYDLQGRDQMVRFVTEMFVSAQFSAHTYRESLTKMLFPATRQGAWRKYHLSGDADTKKRNSRTIAIEDRNLDSVVASHNIIDNMHQDISQEENSVFMDTQPLLKRAKIQSGTPEADEDLLHTRKSRTSCGEPDTSTWHQAQSPKIEAGVEREEEHTQKLAADSARAQSLFYHKADQDVSKSSVHPQPEPVSSQPCSEASATRPTIFTSSTPVLQRSDISLQHIFSAASISDPIDAAIKAVGEPDGSVSLEIAGRYETALESTNGPRSGTSAVPNLGFLTPSASQGLFTTPEASDAVNCDSAETHTVANTSVNEEATSMKIVYRATADDIQAEGVQMRKQIAELVREVEKQETILKRYDKRAKEQVEEIAEQLQEIKELKASRAEKEREFAEISEQMKVQLDRLLAQKDEDLKNLNRMLRLKDESIARLEKHGIERENWIMEMEQNSNKKNQAIKSLQRKFVELAEKLGDQVSEEEPGKC